MVERGHYFVSTPPLLWRHNGRAGVSDHQPHDCLLNRSFRPRKTSKLRVTGLFAGNSPVTDEFPAWPVTWKMFPFDDFIVLTIFPCHYVTGVFPIQMASYAESIFMLWRHDGKKPYLFPLTTFPCLSDVLCWSGVTTYRDRTVLNENGYRNWPRYGLRWSGWYCNPEQHELCRPSRGRLRPRRPAQRVLFRIAVPTTTAQTV